MKCDSIAHLCQKHLWFTCFFYEIKNFPEPYASFLGINTDQSLIIHSLKTTFIINSQRVLKYWVLCFSAKLVREFTLEDYMREVWLHQVEAVVVDEWRGGIKPNLNQFIASNKISKCKSQHTKAVVQMQRRQETDSRISKVEETRDRKELSEGKRGSMRIDRNIWLKVVRTRYTNFYFPMGIHCQHSFSGSQNRRWTWKADPRQANPKGLSWGNFGPNISLVSIPWYPSNRLGAAFRVYLGFRHARSKYWQWLLEGILRDVFNFRSAAWKGSERLQGSMDQKSRRGVIRWRSTGNWNRSEAEVSYWKREIAYRSDQSTNWRGSSVSQLSTAGCL